MKKVLSVLFAMLVSFTVTAEYVTSPINGGIVTFIAKEGNVVKKDEVLFKIEDWFYKNEIERAKIDVELDKAKIKDMKTDIARAKRLYDKRAISLASYEDVILNYYKAEYKLAKSKLELSRMESTLEDYICKAPYDCKVIKNKLCSSSGTQYGTSIIEIQPLDTIAKKETNANESSMLLTAYIQGDLVTWLPKESEVVKKGTPLVKFDTTDIDLHVESLEYTIKEANECVKDSATDIERAKTLAFNEEHAISTSVYEDVLYENEVCSLNLRKLKLEFEYYKKLKSFYTVSVPYDVKVTKRVVSVNSGLKYGTTILELKKL